MFLNSWKNDLGCFIPGQDPGTGFRGKERTGFRIRSRNTDFIPIRIRVLLFLEQNHLFCGWKAAYGMCKKGILPFREMIKQWVKYLSSLKSCSEVFRINAPLKEGTSVEHKNDHVGYHIQPR
jgi:hypothetical protein